MATNIAQLQDKKILEYPIGLGSSELDPYGLEQHYMLFKINTDEKSTGLKEDKVLGKVFLPDGTRQGIGVATGGANIYKVKTFVDDKTNDVKLNNLNPDYAKTQWRTQKGMTRLDKVIILPMPMEHTVGTKLQYKDDFASTDLTKLGDILNNSAGGNASDLFQMVKTKGIAGIVNTVKSGATNEQALNAEDRLSRNPKKEVMYEGFGFRTFNFSYQFAPKSEAESQMVSDIIETFRYYALPELRAGKTFYIFPSEFEISFMLGSRINPHIPKIATSVLKGITVNYMPNSVWSSLPNGAPLSLSISMEFLELELISRERVYTKDNPIVSGY